MEVKEWNPLDPINPLSVNRFQRSILLIAQYKYFEYCSGDCIFQLWSSMQDHAVMVLLLNPVGSFISNPMFCTTEVPASKGQWPANIFCVVHTGWSVWINLIELDFPQYRSLTCSQSQMKSAQNVAVRDTTVPWRVADRVSIVHHSSRDVLHKNSRRNEKPRVQGPFRPGSALGPGASGLPYSSYCTPPVCVPEIIRGLPVLRYNNQLEHKNNHGRFSCEGDFDGCEIVVGVSL